MVKAVIFDLDDTLISEKSYLESGYHHIAKLLGKTLNRKEEDIYNALIELLSESSKNVFNRLFDHYEVSYTKDRIVDLVEEYRNHIPDIAFYDDVMPTITALRKKKIKVGIISDGYQCAQRNKLNVLNAEQYFDKIILTDELGKEFWKPNPISFTMMKEYFDVLYHEMIYVGDNPEKDFYIKKLFPIMTVRITRDNMIYKDREYLNGIKEDVSINNLLRILDIIR